MYFTSSLASFLPPPYEGQLYHQPKGYLVGLASNEGTVFSFPHQLIMYHSQPMYTQIYRLPFSGCRQIRVESTAQVLRQVLDILDPSISNPKVDPDTIFDVLSIADRYEISAVRDWFQEAAITSRTNYLTGVKTKCILQSHPLLVLRCCIHFKLIPLLYDAAEMVIGYHTSLLNADLDIPERWGLWIHNEKQKRGRIYARFVDQINSHWGPTDPSISCTGPCYLHECHGARSRWIVALERAGRDTPCWKSFRQAYWNAPSACSACRVHFPTDCYNLYCTWKKQARSMEHELAERFRDGCLPS
ncbi:hypothetical protein PIIN_05450 [Serendipita indica DSM 11827]|uniref:BTB domain-containing protein n=1 Tax=Serendipita indica (strain DSM 11827) TaxID=1109443 RepID=G4TJM0_SERID|nr:hypothetical protein PIIN_05450 [Serendipita indica DSM 11827]